MGYTVLVNVFFDHLPKCVKGYAYIKYSALSTAARSAGSVDRIR